MSDDMVNQPPHYNHARIECIEAIEAALTPDEFRALNLFMLALL